MEVPTDILRNICKYLEYPDIIKFYSRSDIWKFLVPDCSEDHEIEYLHRWKNKLLSVVNLDKNKIDPNSKIKPSKQTKRLRKLVAETRPKLIKAINYLAKAKSKYRYFNVCDSKPFNCDCIKKNIEVPLQNGDLIGILQPSTLRITFSVCLRGK